MEHKEKGLEVEVLDHDDALPSTGAESVPDDLDPDKKQRQLVDDFITKSLELLKKLLQIQKIVLKDTPPASAQKINTIDLADLASSLLKIQSHFFSDTLGGSDLPENKLSGLARLETVCQFVERLELIRPENLKDECLDDSEGLFGRLLSDSRILHSKIKCTIDGEGDKSGLPLEKLIGYRQDQAWILQTNGQYLFAREQPPEYNSINKNCRKPYEPQIDGIMRATLRSTKDGPKFKDAIVAATELANKLLSGEKNGVNSSSHNNDLESAVQYQCKHLDVYTVLALQEHIYNLTNMQKDIFRIISVICESIGASSRVILLKYVNLFQDDEAEGNFQARLKEINDLIDKIESKWIQTIYEQLVALSSDVSKKDTETLKKGAEDLLSNVTALFNTTIVIESKTRVISSMYPVSSVNSLHPILKISSVFYHTLNRLHIDVEELMTQTRDFANLYNELRREYQSKYGENLSQGNSEIKGDGKKAVVEQNGSSEIKNGGQSTNDQGSVEVLSRGSHEGRPSSTSPSFARKPGFFPSTGSTDGKALQPSPRAKTSKTGSSPRSQTSSPRTPISGSPRVTQAETTSGEVLSDAPEVNATANDVERSESPKSGTPAKGGINPQLRGDGSIRRRAMRASRGKSGVPDQPITPEEILAGSSTNGTTIK